MDTSASEKAAAADRKKAFGSPIVNAAAGDWPVWRGPLGTAVSTESDWTTDWPADGPKAIWHASVGVGFSSVSVAAGRLYTMGHESVDAEQEKEQLTDDTVWCLDAATGDVIWKKSYPAHQVANLHEGGPACTPTVDGDRVFTLSKDGQLYCFDAAKGDIRWKVDVTTLLEVKMPDWGFSCSPRVWGEMLIFDAGMIVALNKQSGELIWKTPADRPGYGSPTFFKLGEESLVAVLTNDALEILRASDGGNFARTPWVTDFATSATTPIVEVTDKGATVFVSTGYDRGCALFDLTDGKLVERYHNRKMRNHMSTCVPWQGVLYGFDGNSHQSSQVQLVAMRYETGEVLWKHRGLGCGSLMLADGKLILLSDEGRLVIAETSPTEFKEIARADVIAGKCWTQPVLATGRIYCRNAQGDVVCLDVRK